MPRSARFLKQILHMPNFLKYALGLPHSWHLLWALTGNFGVLFAFSIMQTFAT